MEEDAFNKYSSHGTGRLADRFFDREKFTTVDMDTKMDESIASTLIALATGETPLQNDSVQSGTQKQLTITDLVASVNSYHPEFTSALDQAKPKQQEVATGKQATQKQQVQPLMQLPPAVSYRHPCIFFHEHRSALSKEDHRRFIMYERIMRSPNKSGKPPSIGPEDHALWIQLQKTVELERSEVRKWNASFIRPRLSSHLHPSFRGAMEPKFRRGRDRVVRDYPQYYDFLSTIGLRLPGMPSGSQKEPVLSRVKPEVQPSSAGTPIKGDVSDALRNRGLLARKGKICQISIARPIWPTDDNGVPIEKEIEVDDSYWKVSDQEVDQVKSGDGKHKDFRRTGHFPKKNRADPVSMDPLVKQFVEEQRVHIALAASTIITLAKVLPSLASEWEIPVKVVLEEDSKGEKHKRIYIDKPLIQKRMTAMEMTQMFYDGALKKLALDGQPPKDVGILKSVVTPPTSASAPKENATPKEDITSKEDTTPKEDGTPKQNAIPKANSTPEKNDPKENTSEGNTMSEDPSQEPGVSTSEQEETLADKDKDSDGAITANVAGDANATGHGSDADDKVGFLGSSAGENSIDNFEYSLWTFGDLRLLIRDRLHGFLADQKLMRQVVLKAILDYAPEIGPGEPGKSSMAGWWMSTWIRDDRLVALGRVDVSKNQFVRYPTQLSENLDFENPLGAVFSDLPALQVLDASQLRLQDREVGEWIKPSMRLIHYVLGKLMQLGPGQYILGHKRFDVNASIYRAADVQSVESRKAASSARYDLHAAHQSSPQLLSENSSGSTSGMAEGSSSQNTNGVSGTVVDDDLVLRWIGTPDQIPGTFPYQEPTGGPSIGSEGDKGRQGYQKKRRGGGGGGGGGGSGEARRGYLRHYLQASTRGPVPRHGLHPFVQDPQVQEWLKLVDFSRVPVYPQSENGVCPEDKTKIPKDQCWWTCQKCDAPEDVTICPKAKSWGLTYDDGPSHLAAHKQKATLFIVGSRAISYPETLKSAYNEGHHIAIHREVDARVRAIATQLGFKTSIWTHGYDTNDWLIPAGTATPQSVIDIFKGWLVNFRQLPTGFIVLQHDYR
ncbi:chitin deacetylase [Podila minutissima]|nr:chitin deacetylase [Podila minutissima]